MPIGAIKHQHMIAALRKIESRGAYEIAHRIKATCARVFSYASQQGIENRNPAADMTDVLKPVKAGHFAAITADELPAFLAAMDKDDARLFKPTRIALRLMMLVLVGQGYEFLDIQGAITELPPEKWADFVSMSFPEFTAHFPTQEAVMDGMETGIIFFGPFLSHEKNSTR